MINREDMLELTRRMTPARSHIDRIAGAYYDAEGYIDGTFNTHFLKLSTAEKNEKSGTGEGSFTGRDQQTAEGLPDSGREVRHANI